MASRRILIDGYNLGLEKGTGVATYARNLSQQLTQLGHEVSVLYGHRFANKGNPLLREIAFFDPYLKRPQLPETLRAARGAVLSPLGHRASRVPITGAVIADAFRARLPECAHVYNAPSLYARSQGSFTIWGNISQVQLPEQIDIAHWTYPLPVRAKGAANIYTLHDLVPLRLPYTTLDNKRRYLALMKKLVRQADHIVTVSECSKRDIIELLDVPPERVTNTYQAVHIPETLREKPENEVAREVEGATGAGFKDYFLFWGSIEPKKNIGRMIESYLASGVASPLVIVGAQAWRSENELRMLKNEHLRENQRIIHLSYVPFNLLVSLIRGARAALFPSLYEGFGLPVLEAMLLGTPVICANPASLPEVAGDAAFLVDPYDNSALTNAIRAMDSDADLRDALAQQGSKQTEVFSAEAYQARIGEVYAKIA